MRRRQGSLAFSTLVVLVAIAAAQTLPSNAAMLRIEVPVPPSAVLTDGLYRLLYEIHLENRGNVPVTLSSLDVRTADGRPRLTLDGDRLIRAFGSSSDPRASLAIAPGERKIVYVDLGERTAPLVLHHVIRTTSPTTDHTLEVPVDRTPPVTLGAPLAGGPWAAVYHSDWQRGHRRVFYTVDGVTRLPGRYAIDFVRLDDGGRTARGDADLVTNSLGYAADALAVRDGTVAAVRDGMPEAARVSARIKHRQEDAAGNYVSLDLGERRFAVYEHLKPGSIRVKAGQRVSRGDVIAQLGFTGDSTGPHLHLHVGDAASPLATEGRPFVFSRFEVRGRYPEIAAMGKTRWHRDGPGVRRDERPGPNVVIDFGEAAASAARPVMDGSSRASPASR